MPIVPRRSSRSRTPLWLVLLVVAAAAIWQYARPRDEAAPAAPPAASTTIVPPARETPASERHDLSEDERQGGHTLARHVGRTDAELAQRLERERGISAASTYTDRVAAETTVARTLTRNHARIQAWLSRSGSRPNLALEQRGSGDTIGRSLARGSRASIPCADALVVLRWNGHDGYYVLTSYPEAR